MGKKQQSMDQPNISLDAESSKEKETLPQFDNLALQMAFLVTKIQSIDAEIRKIKQQKKTDHHEEQE